jgi:replicative superfamily II helicase
VRDELVELCKVKWIGREIARRLYDNGIKTRDDLKRNIDSELVRKITGRFYSRIREELI